LRALSCLLGLLVAALNGAVADRLLPLGTLLIGSGMRIAEALALSRYRMARPRDRSLRRRFARFLAPARRVGGVKDSTAKP
jgi:hypothetical protein